MIPSRPYIITTRVLGAIYLTIFTLSAIFAIPTGNGILALLGSLALIAFPTIPTLFAANYAIAEKFWFAASFLAALMTITIGFALAFTNYLPALIALILLALGLYHLLYLTVKSFTSPAQRQENPLNRKYLFTTLAIYITTATAAWLNAF